MSDHLADLEREFLEECLDDSDSNLAHRLRALILKERAERKSKDLSILERMKTATVKDWQATMVLGDYYTK